MTLTLLAPDVDLDGLGPVLIDALEGLGIDMPALVDPEGGSVVTLTGPFPVHSVDPRDFVEQGACDAPVTGWRALAAIGGHPAILVEQGKGGGYQYDYAFRGREAAEAFARALEVSGQLSDAEESYEVRWLAMPAVYVTALWLAGPSDHFIPTRLGSGERMNPDAILDADRLAAIVRALVEEAAADVGDAGEDETPRSGLDARN